MKLFANAFVIVEGIFRSQFIGDVLNVFPDTFQSRYAFRHCKIRETAHFTSFDCHNEPTYVLSRRCLPTGGGGPGPCCKVDELFTYLMIDRPDVYSHTKYAIHGDDDNFFRVEQVLMFLARLEKIGLSTIPIVGNSILGEYREHVYGTHGCNEIHSYGWYQPLMINRAAMEKMKSGFSSYGVWETCDNFRVTHDVGLGPFLWMYNVFHVRMPRWDVGNHDTSIGAILTHKVVHGSKEDACDNITAFSESQRHNQKILMGCGDVNELQGHHRAGAKDREGHTLYNDNYELWNHFKEDKEDWSDPSWGLHGYQTWDTFYVTLWPNGSKEQIPGSLPGEENTYRIKYVLNSTVDKLDADGTFKGEKVEQQFLPLLDPMDGYETTNHSKQHDIVKKWVGFKPSDCEQVPGSGFFR